MIRLPGNIKICSINDYFLIDQAFNDALVQEQFKYYLYKSLIGVVDFPSKEMPIRVTSALSMLKNIIAPGDQVFKSIKPFGVMAAEQTDDMLVGALISPQMTGLKHTAIPQELTGMPLLTRMKNYDIKNNIDIRMSFVTCNYNVGLTIYDVSKPKVLNYKRQWDYKLETGRFYKESVIMNAIIPREFVYKLCAYYGQEYDPNWFIEHMNTNSNNNLISFFLHTNPGTKKREVFMRYPMQITARAGATGAPEVVEEGDADKDWLVTRSFLMSVNLPTNIFFGRERDPELPDFKSVILDPFADIVNPPKKEEVKNVPVTDVGTTEKEFVLNKTTEIPNYTHIGSYHFTEDDILALKELESSSFEISVFKDIIPEDYLESRFYKYCVQKNKFNELVKPIQVLFKLDGADVSYNNTDIADNYSITIDNKDVISNCKTFSIFVYYHTKSYKDFTKTVFNDRDISYKVINTPKK